MSNRYYGLRHIKPEVGRYYTDQHQRLFYVSRLIDGIFYCHLFNGVLYIETHLEYEHVDGINLPRMYGAEDSVLVAEVHPTYRVEHQLDFTERATDLI